MNKATKARWQRTWRSRTLFTVATIGGVAGGAAAMAMSHGETELAITPTVAPTATTSISAPTVSTPTVSTPTVSTQRVSTTTTTIAARAASRTHGS